MIVVAIILGAVTVLAARSILENPNTTSTGNQEVVEEVQTTTIVIATVPLKFGDEITAGQLKEVEWPTELLPEGAFTSINDVVGQERRVTLRSIDTREPIVKSKISGFGFRATLSQVIGEGRRAVTIRVNDVASVGGFVLPGDEVDVMLSYQDGDDVLDFITKIILQEVRVLAIDQISDDSQEGAIVGKAATLEVTPEEAQKIALASRIGSLSLALRRISDLETVPNQQTEVIKVRDLKPASGDDVVIKPVVKVGTGIRRTKPKPAKPVELGPAEMVITRGTTQSTESVDREANPELAGAGYPSNTAATQDALNGLSNSVRTGVSDTTSVLTSLVNQ